ncbi:MAG: Prokaryotic lipoprotein-attachment site, partial [Pseudomonadota bacterium]
LVSALAMAGVFALSACGQKGDLYLPPAQAAAARAATPASAAPSALPASAPAARP